MLSFSTPEEVQWFHITIMQGGGTNVLRSPIKRLEVGYEYLYFSNNVLFLLRIWRYEDTENTSIDLNGYLLLLSIINSDNLGAAARKSNKYVFEKNIRFSLFIHVYIL